MYYVFLLIFKTCFEVQYATYMQEIMCVDTIRVIGISVISNLYVRNTEKNGKSY